MFWKRLSRVLVMWSLGGSIYYGIEMFFRGFSHWSMFLLGGCCLSFFDTQERVYRKDPLWMQIIRCTIFVVSGEFITGLFVNKWMHWNVWDYSDQPYQLFGQICLPFATIFSGLSAIGIILCGYIAYWFFGEEKPEYHIL